MCIALCWCCDAIVKSNQKWLSSNVRFNDSVSFCLVGTAAAHGGKLPALFQRVCRIQHRIHGCKFVCNHIWIPHLIYVPSRTIFINVLYTCIFALSSWHTYQKTDCSMIEQMLWFPMTVQSWCKLMMIPMWCLGSKHKQSVRYRNTPSLRFFSSWRLQWPWLFSGVLSNNWNEDWLEIAVSKQKQ